tara:strand:+ start:180 stop:821 length:642 start_codon:yes stop_codon:yes gene_type:complete
MRVLELFSGTQSFGKCCDTLGWDVISLDINDNCDIKCDIMKWDYTIYEPDYFDVIWASPPCASFSRLQNSSIGKKGKDGRIKTREMIEENMVKNGDPIVLRTLEILKYLKPSLWFMENPQTGQLKNREYMKDIPYYDVDYCMYCDWGYRKRTRIWTNKKKWKGKKCNGRCGNVDNNGRHVISVGGEEIGEDKFTTLKDRYRVPPELIYSLLME